MSYTYQAFISYSHTDCGKIAPEIQKGIENIGKPWWKISRFINVYRDETNLSANPDLWHTIQQALIQSEFFVLLASPKAAESKWVQKEVKWWLTNRNADSIILVLTKGEIKWLDNDFDWTYTNSLPTILKDKFKGEPLFVDFKDFNFEQKKNIDYRELKLKTGIILIISRILSTDPREIDSADIRMRRNIRTFLVTIVCVLSLLLAGTYYLYKDTETQKNNVTSLFMASESDKQIPIRSAQLLLNAWDLNKSNIIWSKMINLFNTENVLCNEILGENLSISQKHLMLLQLKADDGKQVELTDYNGNTIAKACHSDWIVASDLSPTKDMFLTASHDSTATIWDFKGNILFKFKHNEKLLTGEFISNGSEVFLTSPSYIIVFNLLQKSLNTIKIIKKYKSGFRWQFFPNSDLFLTTSADDSSAIIWNKKGQRLSVLKHSVGISRGITSPSNQLYLAIMQNGKASLFDYSVRNLTNLNNDIPILNACFSPNGKIILTILENNKVKLWNLKGKNLLTIDLPGKINIARFSSDGKKILCAGGQVAVLSTIDGKYKVEFRHSDEVFEAKLSPNNELILTASRDRTAKLWTPMGEEVSAFKHEDGVYDAAFLANKKILTKCLDGITRVWNIKNFPENTIHVTSEDHIVKFNTDLNTFGIQTGYNHLIVYRTTGCWKMSEFAKDTIEKFEISPIGNLFLYTFKESPILKLLDIKNKVTISLNHSSSLKEFSFSLDNSYIISYSKDNTVKLWTNKGELKKTIQSGGAIINVKFSQNSEKVLIATDDGIVKVLSINDGSLTYLYTGEDTSNAEISPDGKKILTYSYLKYFVKVVNLENNSVDSVFHNDLVNNAVFSPDSKKVISVSSDNTAFLLNLYENRLKSVKKLKHGFDVVNAFFSPHSDFILTISDGLVGLNVWNLDGKHLATIKPNNADPSKPILFSSTGDKIVTILNNVVTLWDLNGNLIVNLIHKSDVKQARFTPNGKMLVTVTDQEVKVWYTPEEIKIWAKTNNSLLTPLPSRFSTLMHVDFAK